MKKRFSIQRYLTTYILLWIVAISALTGLWVFYNSKHEVEELFDASLAQSARTLDELLNAYGDQDKDDVFKSFKTMPSTLSESNHGQKNPEHTGNVQNRVEEYEDDDEDSDDDDSHEYEKKLVFQIWSSSGELLFRSKEAPKQPISPLKYSFHLTQVNGDLWRTFALYSETNQWWLLVGEEEEIRAEVAEYITQGHLLPLLFGIPVLVWLLHFLIRKGLSPLKTFAQQLRQKHYQDLSPLDDKEAPEETVDLVNSMNGLFQRLGESYQRESRFTADAAHELRNPLASLMIHTENALEDNECFLQKVKQGSNHEGKTHRDQSNEIQRHCEQQIDDLTHVKSSITRLSHSVQQLLALSKAESLGEQISEWIDMAILAKEVVQQYQHQLDEKKMNLAVQVDQECQYLGNKTQLHMVLGNVLSNAINYSPVGSNISIACYCGKGIDGSEKHPLTMIVEDSGEGIAADEIKRVKERFYRSLGSKAAGAGLGLSIVDAIVERQGGNWTLSKSDLGGLRVEINLV